MTLILILLRTILYACLVAIPYFLYQLIRNEAVYKIRIKWIDQVAQDGSLFREQT